MIAQTTLISLARKEVLREIKDDQLILETKPDFKARQKCLERHKEQLAELNQMARDTGIDPPLSNLPRNIW